MNSLQVDWGQTSNFVGMRRTIFFMAVLGWVAMGCKPDGRSQPAETVVNTDPKADYPQEAAPMELIERCPLETPDEDDYRFHHPHLMGTLMPLGFSVDGKFAYMYERAVEAEDGYYLAFNVLDLVNDSVLLYLRNPNEYDLWNWEQVMAVMQPTYVQQMQKYGIVMERVHRQDFPISTGKGDITIRVEKSVMPISEDRFNERFYKAVEVFLVNAGGEEKSILRRDYESEYMLEFSVCCYLKSPFEDRIVVIIEETSRGWEGPPSPMDYVIVGAHLTKGFAKPR